MKHLASSRIFQLLATIILSAVLVAPVIAEDFPSSDQFGESTLTLNGQGKRKKAIISLYRAGLYLQQGSADAGIIIAADEPMAMRLKILSGFISAEKMQSAMQEGFAQSTGGNTAPIAEQIATFETGFADEISKKDVFDLVYQPGTGVEVIKNGSSKVVVPGLAFKQALFGIWLSDKPIQGSLKKALLGS